MTAASSGSPSSHFEASLLCGCPETESASQTLTSGKNKVMRILVYRESRPQLALCADQRACHPFSLCTLCICLFDSPHNERTDRCAGALSAPAQLVMQWLGDIDG